ncbi:hypothetical protein [Mesobacillus jeotgali]|uniref:Uncharacterized protein n=1 Tax=Mesobacillus jeotgali TaxID=129985 RepID=A0ABY9VQ60_9BACI|nr:hypothetical protein [Mesobacillus jeotgali]WNF24876.1 hypothetical protein RH061_10490 [Mesobacillus jeotgali]
MEKGRTHPFEKTIGLKEALIQEGLTPLFVELLLDEGFLPR